MNQAHLTRFSTRLRLLCGLALFLGLCAVTGGLARPAHAQSTLKVTNCTSDAQLQAEVAQANHDNAGDVISFACSGDIKLNSTFTISGSMTLSGSGQHITLDGQNQVQVFSVNSSVSMTLKALTIAHGFTNGSGGGLLNSGGTVNISTSTFADNSSSNGSGGGLFNNSGTVNISTSTFVNNSAPNGSGGGLQIDGSTASITSSTVANNSAMDGGGFYNGLGDENTVSITNSTFANNSASDGGGGLLNSSGTVSITTSTFADNSASNVGGGVANQDTLLLKESIVANNAGGDCFRLYSFPSIDGGYNLSSDSSCGFTGTGDLQNSNPQLGPLASNGGPTQTMALLKGSPASDVIPLALCPATDQRSHKRPDNSQESACDMGAFES